jgi:hypothetical protein
LAVPTLLADPPTAAPDEQPPGSAPGGADSPAQSSAPAQHSCAKCGSPLSSGQDWCLQCGAGAPDSLHSRAPSWRSAAVILGAVAVLVAGAATAAYAALSKGGSSRRVATSVAQVPPPAVATPATPGVTGTPTTKIGTPTTVKPLVPGAIVKPPKIPTTAPTPTTPAVSTPTPKIPTAVNPSSGSGSATPAAEPTQEAILLDTDAAETYNPYNYPASNFGDPSLAIDGDTTTGWTAQVEPTVAPKMAEGLAIDLHTARKLAALAISTSTPGMTIQVYGANSATLPTSITDPSWVTLSPSRVDAKKHLRIKFGGATQASKLAAKKPYRFVVLWISAAPAASVGTPQAPGHVSVNELELFPLKK